MADTLSQALYGATIIGDVEGAEKIKAQIDKKFQDSIPKHKENIVSFNTILNNDRSSARKVYEFLNRELGRDWWEWEIETIDRVLWIKFASVIDSANRDKVHSIRHLCRSDQPFYDWFEFNQIALSFSGCIADFDLIRKPSSGMVINAVRTMNIIRPDRNSDFGKDVVSYICILLKDEGIYIPPPSLVGIIGEKFETMVSPEMRQEWASILSRYIQLANGENTVINENVVDIQARRIHSAEAAAASYG